MGTAAYRGCYQLDSFFIHKALCDEMQALLHILIEIIESLSGVDHIRERHCLTIRPRIHEGIRILRQYTTRLFTRDH